MANERYTEDLTLAEMKCRLGKNDFGYVYPQGDVSSLDKVERLLKQAGGKPAKCALDDFPANAKGRARPEYIISFNDDAKTLMVIECKKNAKQHQSNDSSRPNTFAVDGVLYYAKFLKQEYNVIAVAVSGANKQSLRVSAFHWPKGRDGFTEIERTRDIILEPRNYMELLKGAKLKKSYSLDEIRNTAIDMHNYLREIRMSERHKPIFIAGLLIALEDPDFAKSYNMLTSYRSVIQNIENSVENVLQGSNLKSNRISYIQQAFGILRENTKFSAIPLGHRKSITWYLEQLELKIKPMMDYADSTLDALGIFYHEFIKYSGGDGKGLGIVLTPQHLTEFMAEAAEVNKNSKVLDICCGSASFLITAMAKMFKDASPREVDSIKHTQLYGVEFDNDLYSLAVANMIIRKDGKSNIYYGDCFDEAITQELTGKNINLGLINPPFAQSDKSELQFMEHLLGILGVGGLGACVVPMSCAIGTRFKEERARLFKRHTLKAVFSMPDEIFYPTGTVTCVMLWEAHKPHDTRRETFFGFYKEDGLVKRKKLGRIDQHDKWAAAKKEWLALYRNKDIKPGLSVRRAVRHDEEWCAEAYMETDYAGLTQTKFSDAVHGYSAYRFMRRHLKNCYFRPKIRLEISLDTSRWQYFKLTDWFTHGRGRRLVKEGRLAGDVPFITAGKENYGFKECIDSELIGQKVYSNAITIDMFGNSFYHSGDFSCDDNILLLHPADKLKLSGYAMIFIATVINEDSYRYAYGRQYRQKNLLEHKIKLPVDKSGKQPDWRFMEDYIKSLPYSSNLG